MASVPGTLHLHHHGCCHLYLLYRHLHLCQYRHKPQAVSTSTPQHAWTFFERSFYWWSFERYWEVDDISAFLGGFLVPYPSKRTQHLLRVSVLSKPSLIQFAQSKQTGRNVYKTWWAIVTPHVKETASRGTGEQENRRLRIYCGPMTYSFGTICRRWRTSLIKFSVLLCRGRLSILWGTQPSLF